MRIGVDLDGVTFEFQQRWAELYCEYFDRYVPFEALNRWDAVTDVTHFSDIEEFYAWFLRAGGWEDMPWIAGSRGGIDALLAAGHDVLFVTARPLEAYESTLNQLFDLWPPPDLWFEPDKARAGCDLYVDDSPTVIQQLANQDHRNVVIFDHPWNRNIVASSLTPRLTRVSDWHQVVEVITHYEQTGLLTLPAKETA